MVECRNTEELHLFIIWSKAHNKEKDILADLESRFEILGIHEVTWDKEQFSKNLTRFYGENLPPNSGKERACGNDTFTLIVVLDRSPLYRQRLTSKGVALVNVNIFDSKEMYREWTGGGHKIHGTNNNTEARHDLVLLTGYSVKDYLELCKKNGSKILRDSFNEMPGEKCWKSMEQLIYVLNETAEYVILRNFKDVYDDYSKKLHGDVDILCSNYNQVKWLLNATPTHKVKYRVQNMVKIGDGGVMVDLRYTGDKYYCKEWQNNILKERILTEEGYYRPCEKDYIYALVYHAIIQKKEISPDYMEIFKGYFFELDMQTDTRDFLKKQLECYLSENKYQVEEPMDHSVYFTGELFQGNVSMKRKIRGIKKSLVGALLFYKKR